MKIFILERLECQKINIVFDYGLNFDLTSCRRYVYLTSAVYRAYQQYNKEPLPIRFNITFTFM